MSLKNIDWEAINISQKDAYLSRKEVAKYLGVCSATISRWEKNRAFPFYRIGSRNFYKRQDVDNWILKQQKL